jgi:ankyrin repeat protein
VVVDFNVLYNLADCLLEQAPHNESKRALRQYYHEQLAPASDVDLFIYGLDEEQAIEKIKQIETKVRDSILQETTTIRTKNAITIASAYPTRHVQIVLRLYKSVSEILTGFDVDCSCVAYDGKMVWATPRAVASYVTQINTIDLTRRSPSYENRLSKYSRRGFEVYWPELDRSKIDPTIFERSFSRVMGLARLLVLEKLPHPDDRDAYLAKRREERGRPPLPWNARHRHQLPGNIKNKQPDDVAEWVEEDDVSDYHTFTVPYGAKYNAKKIEQLLFTKDLLLNAEWNQKDRETALHRHPAFFGSVNDVIHDCCGFCPKPATDEDLAISEEESKIYISGDISFIKDDPGRQTIGSFNPITDEDWTEMAYVGNTQRLCQAIVDGDIEHVQDWCDQDGVDVNARDHTGRTPLQLAALCSTAEVVQCLIDHGARIVSRLADGFTALHIAAQRGNAAMIKALLEKSEANEEEEERKEELKKQARRAAAVASGVSASHGGKALKEGDEDSDHEDSDQMTDGSFVKIAEDASTSSNLPDEEDAGEPDVYVVDVLAWDSPLSPLHLAIMGDHVDCIEELVNNFGADVLLPVKLIDAYSKNPRAAILTLVLAAQLTEATATSQCLLKLGASSTQGDMNGVSTLHYIVNEGNLDVLNLLAEYDRPAASKAINYVVISGYQHQPQVDTPLITAIEGDHQKVIERLLELGARPTVAFDEFAQACDRKFEYVSKDPEQFRHVFEKSVEQPIIRAVQKEFPKIVVRLLDMGADPNTLPIAAYAYVHHQSQYHGTDDKSLLDLVRKKLKALRDYIRNPEDNPMPAPPASLNPDEEYLESLEAGSYRYWLAEGDLQQAKGIKRLQMEKHQEEIDQLKRRDVKGEAEKRAAVQALIGEYEVLEQSLLSKGAKPFDEIYPDLRKSDDANQGNNYHNYYGFLEIKREPYSTQQNFHVPDLTPAYKDGYFNLFEAAWNGDVKAIKELTLGQWGNQRQALQVAVQDLRGFSPFSISVLRGHTELAKTILEIANAQYQPKDKAQRFRYSIRPADGEDESDAESDDENIHVYSELVDDEFSIDDIGSLADRVKSRVSPMDLLVWDAEVWRFLGEDVGESAAKRTFMPKARDFNVYIRDEKKQSWSWFNAMFTRESCRCRWSLVRLAIATNNMKLLKFILAVGSDLAARKRDEDATKTFNVLSTDFDFAVRLGRTEMIGEIIRSTGAAIPLQKLVNTSGVEMTEKPKYYQGLSVYGRKRKDWADAGRGITHNAVENEHPPIHSVAFQGNLESLEYFLSDAPLRRYVEFAESHCGDKRIAALSKSEGGIRKALGKWLGGYRCLMHLALMSKPNKDGSNPALDFLVRTLPHCVEEKDSKGNTPLQLAFQLQRYSAAKTLIAAGANQLTRNAKGENVIHTILSNSHNPSSLRGPISLLEPGLVKPMLLEKCGGENPGSLTPLAQLLRHNLGHWEDSRSGITFLLEYSGGKDLEILDGAGDYPLHYLVRNNRTKLARFVIDYNPSLLSMENATGQTPQDVANTSYLRWRMENPPTVVGNGCYWFNHGGQPSTILDRSASDFVKSEVGADEKYTADAISMWKMCSEMTGASITTNRRKLVSLFDANEVAKRLAVAQQKRTKMSEAKGSRRYKDDGNAIDAEDKDDPVAQWLGIAQSYKNWDLKKFEEMKNEARA